MAIWSEEELSYLKNNYPSVKTELIAKHLKRSERSVYSMAYVIGLNKSEEFRKSEESGIFRKGKVIGVEHRFKKGHVPFNKGKKQSEYMSDEQIKKCSATQFKKGNLPHNTKRDHIISLRTDSSANKKYYHIRLGKAKWIAYHTYLWEQANGKLPENHIVIFKDNNPMNCVLENLEAISRSENMKRNTIHRYPEEIKEVIRLQSKLTKTIIINEKANG